MPFLETIDNARLDRMGRAESTSVRPAAPAIDLTACDSLEAAQTALQGIWAGDQTRLVRIAQAICRRREDAEDCAMEAYAQTALAWDVVKDARSYMRQATRNNALTILRQRRAETLGEPSPEVEAMLSREHWYESERPAEEYAASLIEWLKSLALSRFERDVISTWIRLAGGGDGRNVTQADVADALQRTRSQVANALATIRKRSGAAVRQTKLWEGGPCYIPERRDVVSIWSLLTFCDSGRETWSDMVTKDAATWRKRPVRLYGPETLEWRDMWFDVGHYAETLGVPRGGHYWYEAHGREPWCYGVYGARQSEPQRDAVAPGKPVVVADMPWVEAQPLGGRMPLADGCYLRTRAGLTRCDSWESLEIAWNAKESI
jgi:DNA-directed RNA polymerase specialized sigma24 family protein